MSRYFDPDEINKQGSAWADAVPLVGEDDDDDDDEFADLDVGFSEPVLAVIMRVADQFAPGPARATAVVQVVPASGEGEVLAAVQRVLGPNAARVRARVYAAGGAEAVAVTYLPAGGAGALAIGAPLFAGLDGDYAAEAHDTEDMARETLSSHTHLGAAHGVHVYEKDGQVTLVAAPRAGDLIPAPAVLAAARMRAGPRVAANSSMFCFVRHHPAVLSDVISCSFELMHAYARAGHAKLIMEAADNVAHFHGDHGFSVHRVALRAPLTGGKAYVCISWKRGKHTHVHSISPTASDDLGETTVLWRRNEYYGGTFTPADDFTHHFAVLPLRNLGPLPVPLGEAAATAFFNKATEL